MNDNINELFTYSWGKLFYATIMDGSAFSTGTVATLGNDAIINMRTVVVKAVDPDKKQIVFYTDRRSPKVGDIAGSGGVSWLFYDSAEKIQIRLSGRAVIHTQNSVTAHYWDKVSANSRKMYRAIPAPSVSVNHATDGLEYLNDNKDAEYGYENFAVVITDVNFIEWLHLDKNGHRRAEFRLIDNNWKGQWLIP